MALSSLARAGGARSLEGLYQHLAPAVTRNNEIIATRGEGSWVWTADGRKLLDVSSGIGATSTGHCHPAVVAAVQAQSSNMVHAQQNIFGGHTALLQLVDKLLEVTPPHLSRFFFCNSGSEAVENAIKVARAATGRQNIIAFEGSFHGRTMGAMALTSSKTIYRQGFGPLMPGAFVAPYPYCLHCKCEASGSLGSSGSSGAYQQAPFVPPWGEYQSRTCCNSPVEALEWLLKQQSAPSETAAIILEPIMGEGGFLVPPPSFTKALRRLCTEHGMLLIADEVQSGAGRTGKWWGHQHFSGFEPDIMLFAKGIGSGYPLAGVAARSHLFDRLAPGTLGGTYGGNAVACAAGAATIQAIQDDNMLANAEARGQQLITGLLALAEKFPIVDVRGRGLMIGVEFGGEDGSKVARKGVAAKVAQAAYTRDMLLLTAGARETVRLLPPLNISEADTSLCLDILAASLEDVFGQQRAVKAAAAP